MRTRPWRLNGTQGPRQLRCRRQPPKLTLLPLRGLVCCAHCEAAGGNRRAYKNTRDLSFEINCNYYFIAAVNRSQEDLFADPAVIASTSHGDMPVVNIGCECNADCSADCERGMSVLFNSDRTIANCNSVHASTVQPAQPESVSMTTKLTARERRS